MNGPEWTRRQGLARREESCDPGSRSDIQHNQLKRTGSIGPEGSNLSIRPKFHIEIGACRMIQGSQGAGVQIIEVKPVNGVRNLAQQERAAIERPVQRLDISRKISYR